MSDPIFKGATRPAMLLGVPTKPMIALGLLTVLTTMWSLMLVGVFLAFIIVFACGILYVVLRIVSKDDPHKLNQWFMQIRSSALARPNKGYWGAHSVSPFNYDKKRLRMHDPEE